MSSHHSELSARLRCSAFERGDTYATTGVRHRERALEATRITRQRQRPTTRAQRYIPRHSCSPRSCMSNSQCGSSRNIVNERVCDRGRCGSYLSFSSIERRTRLVLDRSPCARDTELRARWFDGCGGLVRFLTTTVVVRASQQWRSLGRDVFG